MYYVELYYVYEVQITWSVAPITIEYVAVDLIYIGIFVFSLYFFGYFFVKLKHDVLKLPCMFFGIACIFQNLIVMAYNILVNEVVPYVFFIAFSFFTSAFIFLYIFRYSKKFIPSILSVASSFLLAISGSAIVGHAMPGYYFDYGVSVARVFYASEEYKKSILILNRKTNKDYCIECYSMLALNYVQLAENNDLDTVAYFKKSEYYFSELSRYRNLNNVESDLLDYVKLKLEMQKE